MFFYGRIQFNCHFFFSTRLREHIEKKHNLPILIFPEGTCINNTSIMMFKKGSFELGAKIYPIAIKVTSFCSILFCFSMILVFTVYFLLLLLSVYKDEIVDLYKSVVDACITASDHIPTISHSTAKVMPGWNDGVKYSRDEALSWHHF